jgi:hypothetical protein
MASILSHLKHVKPLEGRSNYQIWRSSMEGIFQLEGLWNIVSGFRPRPTPTAGAASTTGTTMASASASSSTGTRSRTAAASSTPTGGSDDRETEQWLADACGASITLELSLADEQKFLLEEIPKEDPHGQWTRLEKQFLPDTAVETAKLYRQLLDIRPRENESPAAIFERVAKATAAIVKTARASEINSDILLAAFTLNLVSMLHLCIKYSVFLVLYDLT